MQVQTGVGEGVGGAAVVPGVSGIGSLPRARRCTAVEGWSLGPRKVMVSVLQLMSGFVSRSQGNPSTIGVDL